MKITYIEIEANKEEISASNTLADGVSNMLRRILNSCNSSNYGNDCDEEGEEDD